MSTLGLQLASRGHKVSIIGTEPSQLVAERCQLGFVQMTDANAETDRIRREFEQLGECSNLRSMFKTGKIFGMVASLQQEYLPSVFERSSWDGIVVDQFSPAACEIAEKFSIPLAIACNALAMYWDPLMPPPPLPWGFRDDWFGRARNRLAKSALSWFYLLFSNQRSTGVHPLKLIFEQNHGLVQVAQQPDFFDFPRQGFPDNFHYSGPWHQLERDDQTVEFPWERLDGRPLIYASMGTIQNRLGHVFKSIVTAVAEFPYQVVLSRGGGQLELDGPLPGNVLVVEMAPQLRLLEKASLVITHAGLNTALECLAHGVPMLCIPVTNDQPGVAKRIEWLGAGRLIPARRVTPAIIRRELQCLLKEPAYQQQAALAAEKIQRAGGLSRAAELIERAFLHNGRVPR